MRAGGAGRLLGPRRERHESCVSPISLPLCLLIRPACCPVDRESSALPTAPATERARTCSATASLVALLEALFIASHRPARRFHPPLTRVVRQLTIFSSNNAEQQSQKKCQKTNHENFDLRAWPRPNRKRYGLSLRLSRLCLSLYAQENAGGDAAAKPDEATLKKQVEQQEKVGSTM